MTPRAYITVLTACFVLLAIWAGLVHLLVELGH